MLIEQKVCRPCANTTFTAAPWSSAAPGNTLPLVWSEKGRNTMYCPGAWALVLLWRARAICDCRSTKTASRRDRDLIPMRRVSLDFRVRPLYGIGSEIRVVRLTSVGHSIAHDECPQLQTCIARQSLNQRPLFALDHQSRRSASSQLQSLSSTALDVSDGPNPFDLANGPMNDRFA
jgi:hypothetical protein